MARAETLERLLESCGALLRGHFQLSSGLHSPGYVQCALLLADPARADEAGRELAAGLRARGLAIDSVLSPALGGVIIGHEVAAALGVPTAHLWQLVCSIPYAKRLQYQKSRRKACQPSTHRQ